MNHLYFMSVIIILVGGYILYSFWLFSYSVLILLVGNTSVYIILSLESINKYNIHKIIYKSHLDEHIYYLNL